VKVAFEFEPEAAAATTAAGQGAGGGGARVGGEGGGNAGVPGRGCLFVNGRPVAEGPIRRIVYQAYESLDIGADLGTPVSPGYRVPFAYRGQLGQVTLELR
jgi:arylsulfatase